MDIINDPAVSKMEKLRLAMLFSLKYENDSKIYDMKRGLKNAGLEES